MQFFHLTLFHLLTISFYFHQDARAVLLKHGVHLHRAQFFPLTVTTSLVISLFLLHIHTSFFSYVQSSLVPFESPYVYQFLAFVLVLTVVIVLSIYDVTV